ncbi:MAG: aminodeoxychorismate synthase, component I [Chloroflexi bacterium]|nr:aminodeoxychorismate synthase, component I [Chloroflexota bacterium]
MERAPVIQEVSTSLPPPRVFELFQDRPFSFFLDSANAPHRLGRYSFIGADPFLVLKSCGKQVTLTRDGAEVVRQADPFEVLRELLETCALPDNGFPMPGGAAGYLSYDLGRLIERLPARAVDDLFLPECCLAFYDAVITIDHQEGKVYAASSGFPETDESRRRKRAGERLRELRSLVESYTPVKDSIYPAAGPALKSNFTPEAYLKTVERVREYIKAGDIFQVNLSQRFEADLRIPAYELYRRLRRINPSPFAAYLNFDDVKIVGASPERFLRVRGDTVETRPIKGTRPRGQTPAQDEALSRELLASAKDRAENIMIVDLERNDLGRVCRYGSVRVTELAALETYPTVFHLTSTVQGRLAPGKDRIDLLKASFPGGSITGAPKVRAMEIIEELEPTRRSVYTGAIGYLGFGGSLDLNIVIRTFLVKGHRAYFQVGGGIVYDSEPEAEYHETLDKARSLIRALQAAA